VSSATPAAVTVAAPDAGGGEAAGENGEFSVVLSFFGEKKVAVITAVRMILGLGSDAAAKIVENAPVMIKEGASKELAEQIKGKLEDAGATIF
jgi:large subunit ribosomal protein L7/L12